MCYKHRFPKVSDVLCGFHAVEVGKDIFEQYHGCKSAKRILFSEILAVPGQETKSRGWDITCE